MSDTIETLRKHNAWRRGELDEQPHTPKQIGKAIDAAVEGLREAERLREHIKLLELHMAFAIKECRECKPRAAREILMIALNAGRGDQSIPVEDKES